MNGESLIFDVFATFYVKSCFMTFSEFDKFSCDSITYTVQKTRNSLTTCAKIPSSQFTVAANKSCVFTDFSPKNNSRRVKITRIHSFFVNSTLISRKKSNIFLFFQLGKNIVDYQNQAKRLFKTLTATSPIKCSIESGPYLFQ